MLHDPQSWSAWFADRKIPCLHQNSKCGLSNLITIPAKLSQLSPTYRSSKISLHTSSFNSPSIQQLDLQIMLQIQVTWTRHSTFAGRKPQLLSHQELLPGLSENGLWCVKLTNHSETTHMIVHLH